MPHALVEHYRTEVADYQTRIDSKNKEILNRDDKTPSEEQLKELEILENGLRKATADLKRQVDQEALSVAARDAVARAHVPGDVGPVVQYRDEGSALADFLNRREDEAARYRFERAMEANRAAQHMGTTAGNTTATAGGFDGLLVTENVGPIVRLFPQNTPFLTLIGAQDVRGSMRFVRLIDPDFATAAGPHAGDKEKGELPSRKWDYLFEDLRPVTVGNYINLSAEAELLIPGALNEIVDHLRARTEYALEARAIAEAAKTGKVIPLDPDADAAAVLAAVWDAWDAVYEATFAAPTWMLSGPKGMSMLGQKVDLANRPMFPFAGPTNALGTTNGFGIVQPFGLTYAISPAITDTSIYVGNSFGLSAFVRRLPVLQAVEPSVYGRQVGAAALLAFHRPITTEATTGGSPTPAKYDAIVKVGS